ncbi:MAG: hypothetical protein ACFFC7_10095 [Candidatus Hermodarchaeota archaeon]
MERWSQIRTIFIFFVIIICISTSLRYLELEDNLKSHSFLEDLTTEPPLASKPASSQISSPIIALKSPGKSSVSSSTINITHSEYKNQTASLNQTIAFGSAQEACNSSIRGFVQSLDYSLVDDADNYSNHSSSPFTLVTGNPLGEVNCSSYGALGAFSYLFDLTEMRSDYLSYESQTAPFSPNTLYVQGLSLNPIDDDMRFSFDFKLQEANDAFLNASLPYIYLRTRWYGGTGQVILYNYLYTTQFPVYDDPVTNMTITASSSSIYLTTYSPVTFSPGWHHINLNLSRIMHTYLPDYLVTAKDWWNQTESHHVRIKGTSNASVSFLVDNLALAAAPRFDKVALEMHQNNQESEFINGTAMVTNSSFVVNSISLITVPTDLSLLPNLQGTIKYNLTRTGFFVLVPSFSSSMDSRLIATSELYDPIYVPDASARLLSFRTPSNWNVSLLYNSLEMAPTNSAHIEDLTRPYPLTQWHITLNSSVWIFQALLPNALLSLSCPSEVSQNETAVSLSSSLRYNYTNVWDAHLNITGATWSYADVTSPNASALVFSPVFLPAALPDGWYNVCIDWSDQLQYGRLTTRFYLYSPISIFSFSPSQVTRFSSPELAVTIVDRYNSTVSTAQVTYEGDLGNGSLNWNATKADYRTKLDSIMLEPEIYQLTIWVDWQGYSTSQTYFIEVVDDSIFFTDPVIPVGWQTSSQVVVGITITEYLRGIQGNMIGYRLAYVTTGQNLTEQPWHPLTGYNNAASISVEETLHLLYDGEIQLEWRAKAINSSEYRYSSIYSIFLDTKGPEFFNSTITSGWYNNIFFPLGVTIRDTFNEINATSIAYRFSYDSFLDTEIWTSLSGYLDNFLIEVLDNITLPIDEGSILVQWRAADVLGNMNFYTATLKVDIQPPKVQINYLVDTQRCGVQLKLEEEGGSEISEIQIKYKNINSSQWQLIELPSSQIKEELEIWITTEFSELLITVLVFDEAGNVFQSNPKYISIPKGGIISSSELIAEIVTFTLILGSSVVIRGYLNYKKGNKNSLVP